MRQQKVIREVLKVVPDAEVILLYGSRVTKTHRPDSDWNIRVIVPEHLASKYIWADYQATIDCNLLEQHGWNEHTTPKIDLNVSYFISQGQHKIIWRKRK